MNRHSQRVSIAPDHPCLAGHFPGNPVVPGVVLLQQVVDAARLWLGTPQRAPRIHQVKFLSPLRPGETMEIALDGDATALRFRCSCGERLLAQGSLSL